ncbi:MAG: hypothetical protein ACI8TF_000650 [Paracoccaceae bacterium]|jgi:hypothetical protein
MRTTLALVFSLILGLPSAAQDVVAAQTLTATDAVDGVAALVPLDAAGLNIDDFLWASMLIVVFADTPADPRFQEQLRLLADRPQPLLDRDVVIIVDADPAARSEIRLNLRPRGFGLVLIGKDGSVGLRRPSPRDVREIIRGIDNMPLRIEEIRRAE